MCGQIKLVQVSELLSALCVLMSVVGQIWWGLTDTDISAPRIEASTPPTNLHLKVVPDGVVVLQQ